MEIRIVWFRRDLRVHDNEALLAAVQPGTAAETHAETGASADDIRVVPLFVLDDRLIGSQRMSPARLAYLSDALGDLNASLRERGGRLVVRRGRPEEVVPELAEEVGATRLHLASDVTPFAARRDVAVVDALAGRVEVVRHGGVMIRPVGSVTTSQGDQPSKVYSPFRRAWERGRIGGAIDPPLRIPAHGDVRSDGLPSPADLGVGVDGGRGAVPPGQIEGGETAARGRARRFLLERAEDYGQRRDLLAENGTSRLSADLHYGCLSPRAVYVALDRRKPGHKAFAQELVWRDFYGHVMGTWPEARDHEFDPRYRSLPWHGEDDDVAAWREGRTGYPIVDAAQRQLLREGWMHNRARMITASFLCKDLLVDWRIGEAHFLRHLVDGDVASNNGGWQWAAGCGTDAQPYYRIFNPVTQGEKFDPDGAYVRRYVPELAEVPTRWIHHPWDMADDIAAAAGVRLGTDYPKPLVDHAEARREALAWFDAHRSER